VGSSGLKRELSGIALLLFALFLAVALVTLGLAEAGTGVGVRSNVGWLGYWLARPLVAFVGWPAAALTPLVPAVHALRLFGRLESDPDRSWMIFFAGVVALLPIAIGLGVNAPLGTNPRSTGLWGAFISFYWREWFGGVSAWIVMALAGSILTAITLRWNPVRMIVGRKAAAALPVAGVVAAEEAYAPPKSRRKKKDQPDNLALSLEPAPEEFDAIDPVAALQAASSADADDKEDAAIEEASS